MRLNKKYNTSVSSHKQLKKNNTLIEFLLDKLLFFPIRYPLTDVFILSLAQQKNTMGNLTMTKTNFLILPTF